MAPMIDKSELKIDFSKSADDAVNRIKAFSPVPGAYGILDKKRVKLFDATQ